MTADIESVAARLLEAARRGEQVPLLTATEPGFDVEAAYRVLAAIAVRRRADGWRMIGRKIGFTNSTLWSRYGVTGPMWAPTWDRTVQFVRERGVIDITRMTEPRIEPEIVFRLASTVPPAVDACAALDCVEWVAAGFEIVQSPFKDWKFRPPDCTAAFGLHAALIVGEPRRLDSALRAELARRLPDFPVVLSRDGTTIDRGVGANVLGSPALALVRLAELVGSQGGAPALESGEIITTGTLTDAWPVAAGQTWVAEFGGLGIVSPTLEVVAAR